MIQEKIKEEAGIQPEVQEEHLVGVIPDVYKSKIFGGKEAYDLVITTKRFIFALLPGQGNKPYVSRLSMAPEKYASKTTGEILFENKRNFVVDREQIKSLTFNPGKSYVDCCRKYVEVDGELEIATPKVKYTLGVPFRRVNIAKNVLAKVAIAELVLVKPETGQEAGHSSQGSCCSR